MKRNAIPSSSLEVLEQVDHLRLGRHVERAHRLVHHDELRVGRERAGDPGPLELPAGELARVALEVLVREPDEIEQLAPRAALARRTRHALRPQRLDHAVEHGRLRVERRVGVLEHELHAVAQRAERHRAWRR